MKIIYMDSLRYKSWKHGKRASSFIAVFSDGRSARLNIPSFWMLCKNQGLTVLNHQHLLVHHTELVSVRSQGCQLPEKFLERITPTLRCCGDDFWSLAVGGRAVSLDGEKDSNSSSLSSSLRHFLRLKAFHDHGFSHNGTGRLQYHHGLLAPCTDTGTLAWCSGAQNERQNRN